MYIFLFKTVCNGKIELRFPSNTHSLPGVLVCGHDLLVFVVLFRVFIAATFFGVVFPGPAITEAPTTCYSFVGTLRFWLSFSSEVEELCSAKRRRNTYDAGDFSLGSSEI